MTTVSDDYETFLQTWKPSELSLHTSLAQNLFDPYSYQQLLGDSSGAGPAQRMPPAYGQFSMELAEKMARSYEFFEANQAKWADHFRDYALNPDFGVPPEKFDAFAACIATEWVTSSRNTIPSVQALMASVRDYDRKYHPGLNERYVKNTVTEDALFAPDEMQTIFKANSGLIDQFLADYIDHLGHNGPGSISNIYVRRGAYMKKPDTYRHEKHYLNSYSLSIGPVEQFAWNLLRAKKGKGTPSIYSAPVAAIQDRIVAFAPFIEGMDLSQLEIVVAPAVSETPYTDQGEFGGIREFSFR